MSLKLYLREDYRTLSVLFLVFTIILIWLKKFKNISKGNPPPKRTVADIPSIKTLPFWTPQIIEGFAFLYRAYKGGIETIFETWASTNYSPLASFSAPNFQKVVFVTEPELIKKSLGSLDSQFIHKPKFFYDKLLTTFIKDGLFGAEFSVWKNHRKILNKLFTYGMLPNQLKIVDKCAQQLITELDSINSSTIKREQFHPMIYSTTLKLILEMLAGPDIITNKGVKECIDRFRIMKRLTPYRLLHPFYIIDFIWKRSQKGKAQQESISFLEKYFDDTIEKVIQTMMEDIQEADVRHMLINKMERKEIRDEMATIIAAGHETTDITIHFLMQHLGEHLDIQRKCQEEIDAVFSSKSSTDMTMDDLASLKYLEQCILETLRLTPTVPMFARELQAETELDNVFLEKGTILLFCPWIVHRHPNYYQDAEKFDPDRFTQEKVQARHPYSFIPFSSGPRNCIGWKMAIMELKIITSWILRHYNIYTKDKLADVKLTFQVTLMPKRKFNIWLEKREDGSKNME